MTDAMTHRRVPATEPDAHHDDGSRPRPAAPPLATTASVVGGGHLTWLGWTWAVSGVLFIAAMALIIGLDGHLDASLWQSAGASWQRYVIFAAGVTTLPSFLTMFVANGVTRSQLSASSTVAMVAVAVAGALFVLAGFVVESVFFGSAGWDHTMNDGTPMATGAELVVVTLRYALLFCVWFTAGWLIGAGFYRYGFFGGMVLIIPFAIPVVVAELLIGQDAASINIDVANGLVDAPFAVAAVVGVGLIALNATIARAFTHPAAVH